MKKIFTYAFIIIISSALSILVFTIVMGDNSSTEEGVIREKLYSNILGEERELIIHLPRDYDSTKIYPVMYVLDGGSLDTHIAEKFDILTTAGYTLKTIIVGIPNMSAENRERNLTPPYMRRDNDDTESKPGEADQFLRFMQLELFPFIARNYPVTQTRLISGNSRGGLFVMYSLIAAPDLFQARFCFSTPFWRQDNILVSKVADFLNSKDTLNTFIYMSAGKNETDNMKNGLNKMTATLKEKAPVGVVFYSSFTSHAIHQNNAQISASDAIARWSEYIKTSSSESSQ